MEDTATALFREQSAKRFGKYRGSVVATADPETRGRLRLRVPSVLGDDVTPWALPCLPYGGRSDQGSVLLPDVGAQVWVEFEEGDISHPIWTGTFYPTALKAPAEGVSPDAPETTRSVRTAAGHRLVFEDRERSEAVTLMHASGARIHFAPDGSVHLADRAGAVVRLDATGEAIEIADRFNNALVMEAGGIAIHSAKVVIDSAQVMLGGEGGEAVLRGESFLQLFASHTHTVGPAVTSPPIPQGEPLTLSRKVRTS